MLYFNQLTKRFYTSYQKSAYATIQAMEKEYKKMEKEYKRLCDDNDTKHYHYKHPLE